MSEEQPAYTDRMPHLGYGFVDGLGFGFTTGLAGSSIGRFFGGLRRGGGLAGAARAVVGAGTPRAAGTLAAYFALYEALEIAMDRARPNRQDLWNLVAAGAVSWAALGVRRGAVGAAIVAVDVAAVLVDGRIPFLDKPPNQQRPLPMLHAPTTS